RRWRSVFRQLVAGGLLDVQIDGYGALRLTSASRAVLRGEQTVRMRDDPLPAKTSKGRRSVLGSLPTSAGDLRFDRLRRLRAQLAREQNVPAYVIFHDATLREIAEREPQD